MTSEQIGASIALAVIGLLLVVVSAISRDDIHGELSPFANRLSKLGIFVGGSFMLPIIIILLVSIIVGLAPR